MARADRRKTAHAWSPRPLLALADPPARFKENPSFRLAINFRCEAPRKSIQIAATLRGATYQVSCHGPDAFGEFYLQQAQLRRIDTPGGMGDIGWRRSVAR
jgi:hypothetical protein